MWKYLHEWVFVINENTLIIATAHAHVSKLTPIIIGVPPMYVKLRNRNSSTKGGDMVVFLGCQGVLSDDFSRTRHGSFGKVDEGHQRKLFQPNRSEESPQTLL